jgi:NAD(P)-dependent dehydrogenase (short-subunit alcohol dehydrogenase family)
MAWDSRDLPSQHGKTFVVTGGNAGIGYFVCEQLAAAGAHVILASRSAERVDAAIAAIREIVPTAELGFVLTDLSSLESVGAAAAKIRGLGSIDGLALNAGLTLGNNHRRVTADGLELAVGTNYLGHFALVAQSFSALSPAARVVSMGSMSTRLRRADIYDLLQERRRYSWSRAYAYSKHAMQAFGFELDRRLRASGSGIHSLVAHPGFSTDVQAPPRSGVNELPRSERLGQNLVRFMTQGRDGGAWPMVRALLDPDAKGGDFFGPSGGLKGKPELVKSVAQDLDPEFGRTLWEKSEGWTGVRFGV